VLDGGEPVNRIHPECDVAILDDRRQHAMRSQNRRRVLVSSVLGREKRPPALPLGVVVVHLPELPIVSEADPEAGLGHELTGPAPVGAGDAAVASRLLLGFISRTLSIATVATWRELRSLRASVRRESGRSRRRTTRERLTGFGPRTFGERTAREPVVFADGKGWGASGSTR
jgi:hypothetical protein